MASINSLKASDGSGNAAVATVQSTRSGGASTIAVNTVAGIPPFFHGTMGTPHTFTDPVTSETITVISEASAVDFEGHVDGTNLEIDTIAPGYTDSGSAVGDIVIIRPTTQWADAVAEVLEVEHNDDGTLKDDSVVTANITDASVTTAKLAGASVTNAKLATGAGEPGGAWESWTPTYTNITVGNGTVVAKYKKIGKTVFARWSLTCGSTTAIATGAAVSLPSTSDAVANTILGTCFLLDASSGNRYAGWVKSLSTTEAQLEWTVSGSEPQVNTAFPITETSGDVLSMNFSYEEA